MRLRQEVLSVGGPNQGGGGGSEDVEGSGGAGKDEEPDGEAVCSVQPLKLLPALIFTHHAKTCR